MRDSLVCSCSSLAARWRWQHATREWPVASAESRALTTFLREVHLIETGARDCAGVSLWQSVMWTMWAWLA